MRISEKEQIALEKMFSDLNHIRLELARKTFPADIKDKLDTIEKTIDNDFNSLAENIGSLDPTLVKSIIKDKGKVLHHQERWFGTDAVISILDGKGFDELLKLTSPEEEYHRIVLPEKT